MTTPFTAGDLVRARSRSWRLEQVDDHGSCATLHLVPADGLAPADRRVLVHPIDEVTPLAADGRPAVVSCRAFWHRTAARLLSLKPFDSLVAPVTATLDILPYQLEPALAVTTRGWRRVLLADAVGLGKTVQAGLILAELFARGHICRALVLVPAALVGQWASELRGRFSLEATSVDHGALRELAADLPRTVNPWLVPAVAVVSIDLAKRPEVRAGLAEAAWDAVVVDEAHVATGESARHDAADALARQAPYVILATATPHSGDDGAFAALAGLGAVRPDEPIALFRRSRSDVGLASSRRSIRLRVRPGPAERRALRLLAAYARLLWSDPGGERPGAARLVATVLIKRACSSPGSLRRSVLRRRTLLAGHAAGEPAQLALPLGEDTDPADAEPAGELGTPGLADSAAELAWLDALAAAAADAAREHRKRQALERFLRRVREPVIVFTEYRDTLDELCRALCPRRRCVTLHGGLTGRERDDALGAFAADRADVLLATDAAGLGLNLQARCRIVVDLELPWNPVRLEQRAGRVDRIGQSRRVHVVHLVGRGTAEERVLARLAERARRVREALADDHATVLPPAECDVAEAMLGLRAPGSVWDDRPQSASAEREAVGVERCRLVDPAAAEAASLVIRRRLRARLRGAARPARAEAPGICVAAARRRSRDIGTEADRSPGILVVGEVRITAASGAVLDETLVASRIDTAGGGELPGGLSLPELADAVRGASGPWLDAAARARQASVRAGMDEADGRARARAAGLSSRPARVDGAVQVGLFDRRAERRAGADRRQAPPGAHGHTTTAGGATGRVVGILAITGTSRLSGGTR